MTIRDRIRDALAEEVELPAEKRSGSPQVRQGYVDEQRARKVAQIRSSAVAEAFENHSGKSDAGAVTVHTRWGEVVISALRCVEGDQSAWVEVWIGGATTGEPQYRIVNPPTLLEHYLGTIDLHGRTYVEDPLGAVAEVIARDRKGARR